ncbi:NAD(P)/FAD-dependent oxidoreductase [Melittangium boletus]|uniref:FAD-dependent oxidoreductase n=1 Tax=Melittangium boletus DSM 14713 TaxID=1294270 RepID=A0A250IA60_9BACT|nr:NAD(P)/FAD-dependent oxidoreductase [Melittangium boletus]ATB28103.1 FAD-dependent oxidoreductase [Melittangium boletus DSM 14713]
MTAFQTSTVDVVVVGAGPAGLASAIVLAEAGLRVLLCERHLAPRATPAESLHPGCETLLERLGVGDAFRGGAWPRYTGIRVAGRLDRFGGDARGPWLGFHIHRERFEALLEARAVALGVEVRRGVTVRGLRREGGRAAGVLLDEGAVAARWVIDATGRQHGAERWLGLRRECYSAPLVAWRGEVAGGPMDEDGAARFERHGEGWLWTARLGPEASTWTLLAPRGQPPPALPAHLAGLPTVLPRRGMDVSWRAMRPLVKPGCLVVGDAAAVFDPAAGQGVFFALRSGITAAETLRACLARPFLEAPLLAAYDDWALRQVEYKVHGLRELYRGLGMTLARMDAEALSA